MYRTWTLTAALCACFAVTACDPGSQEMLHETTPHDSLARVDSMHGDSVRVADSVDRAEGVKEEVFPEIPYRRTPISSKGMLDSIRKRFARNHDSAAYRVITTLNRKEFGYIRLGDTLALPDSIVGDLRAYSVFPQRYPAADTIPKIIMISNALQAYACYEHGRLVRFAACNTGTERKPTFPGRYALTWRERLRISSLNDEWKLPFTWNFHLYAGNAFHQFAMPGRPVSHSCVRQFMTDAQWLFGWGQGGKRDSAGRWIHLSGTPVIIIDNFDFTRKRGGPWLELASNRDGILKLPDHPMGVEEAWIPISQVPKDARGAIANRQRYLVAEDTLRARGIIREGVTLSASIDYNDRRRAKAVQRSSRSESRPPQKPDAVQEPKPVEKAPEGAMQ